jgi:iron complex transport system ATP-binding protein
MTLVVAGVDWAVGPATILDDVDVVVPTGAVVGLLGPNGSGKTSLLRCVARLRRPDCGVVSLDGADLATMRRRDLGRRMALVEQHGDTEVDLRVLDVVLLGRTPHQRPLQGDTATDHEVCRDALARVDMLAFAERPWSTLSGGERQRVHLARAIAQQPALLVLDEPTNHLDLGHQQQLLTLVRSAGFTSLAALHDLNLAAMYCDSLVVLERGRVRAAGPPAEVLTADLLADVYGVTAEVVTHPRGGHPVVILER